MKTTSKRRVKSKKAMGDRIGNGRPFSKEVRNGLRSKGRHRPVRVNRKMVNAGVAALHEAANQSDEEKVTAIFKAMGVFVGNP
jgi:hypothetical protein